MTWLKTAQSELNLIKLDSVIAIDVNLVEIDSTKQLQVVAYVPAGNAQCYRNVLAIFQQDAPPKAVEAAVAKLLVDIRLCCHPHVLDVQKILEGYLANGL